MSLRRPRFTHVALFLAFSVIACFAALGAADADGPFAGSPQPSRSHGTALDL